MERALHREAAPSRSDCDLRGHGRCTRGALHAQRLAADIERRRTQAELELEQRRRDAEMADFEAQLEATKQLRLVEIEQLAAQARTLRELVQALPQIATSLASNVDTMHYTQIGSGDSRGPLDVVPAAIAQLLALAQSFGLELPRRGD